MGPLDTVSLSILLGAALVLAGILSSLVALRFGAPLLLVFLIVGPYLRRTSKKRRELDDRDGSRPHQQAMRQ